MILLLGILIAYIVVEHGCSDRPASKGPNWFEMLQSGELVVSKKSRTRGDVDHHGRTRRQRAHTR